MRAKLMAMQEADFDKWYQAKAAAPALSANAAHGLKLLQSKGCLGCHTTTGQPLVGPSYKGIYGSKVTVLVNGKPVVKTVDDKYLEFMITHPDIWVVHGYQPIMPAIPLTDKEVDDIIAYIKTLK
ncbi:MAG: cytochrome c [Actinomycetota bacterium]|nr:cytochrome c [Actinomycetota bacterium]MDA8173147.1 cytochrome c [Nitrospiraceae bacterium]